MVHARYQVLYRFPECLHVLIFLYFAHCINQNSVSGCPKILQADKVVSDPLLLIEIDEMRRMNKETDAIEDFTMLDEDEWLVKLTSRILTVNFDKYWTSIRMYLHHHFSFWYLSALYICWRKLWWPTHSRWVNLMWLQLATSNIQRQIIYNTRRLLYIILLWMEMKPSQIGDDTLILHRDHELLSTFSIVQ